MHVKALCVVRPALGWVELRVGAPGAWNGCVGEEVVLVARRATTLSRRHTHSSPGWSVGNRYVDSEEPA
jgi:hypothetical protein